ncbi:bicaudal-D-related protein 2-like [Mugil cephalus]|uniref:bicaudal-D-related protein 2-like n=1 Tax=Mugil cephalus TaxID=48193 RepID=UPI001FB7E7E7|nr:bicaudal-D-related protein 2-like [Mugil cephalus]XP_047462940.1 bicaudal-D-related protein 2-like [Mugil cephalus]
MDYSQPFSVLNERLRPRYTSSDRLYSSLNRLEGSLRNRPRYYRPTILSTEPKPTVSVTVTGPADPEKPERDMGLEQPAPDYLKETNCSQLLAVNNSCLISELNLKDEGEEDVEDDDSCSSHSEDKDIAGELASEDTRDPSDSGESVRKHEERFNRSYYNGTLPDLIKSGRPLSRRRTLGHVSDTLKEVRREVELSRRRSIKLKAQVDKLQENRDGPGWSQDRERVTEEVLSILRLLHPLTEPESSQPEPSDGKHCLDSALAQLQNVARTLAISHTKQDSKSAVKGAEESAILQQALRDRDEAIEKKKAMETELLRSKTEMMMLNNQLLEAVQKRLEMSLELEAWKEDIQLMLQQQLQSQQQQAEQAQKKTSRMGLLRRNKAPVNQRPSNFPVPAQANHAANSSQASRPAAPAAPMPSTPPTQRTWRDKLRRGKTTRQEDQDAECCPDGDGFQAVSLD